MKALIWNYAMAVAKLDEAKALNGNIYRAAHVVILSQQAIACMLERRFDTMAEIQPLANAIQGYARAFSRERLAYRFGIGETAVTNIARIKAQRELFAQLAK